MEKKKYFVSVQAGSMVEDEGAAAYELVIEATEQEASELQALFDEWQGNDNATFVRGQIPAIPYHQDQENDRYDHALKEIYRRIYDLGTADTKRHIEGIGVLSDSFFPYP